MADSYSFDVVSDFDRQELVNAVDQVRREVGQRYDLKDSATEIDVEEASLTITTASDMTLDAVMDVLRQKATKRNLSLKIFDLQTPEPVGGNRVKQVVKLRKGLSQELAKTLSKLVRDQIKKVTVAIQGVHQLLPIEIRHHVEGVGVGHGGKRGSGKPSLEKDGQTSHRRHAPPPRCRLPTGQSLGSLRLVAGALRRGGGAEPGAPGGRPLQSRFHPE